MRKYTLSRIKGRLSSGKEVFFRLKDIVSTITYNIDIELFRVDIIKDASIIARYPKETYVLIIEKYNSEYPGDKEGGCIIDLRLEFSSVEEVINYLDKEGFVKRGDWILE